jgi:putative ABC transport system permease protein
LFEAVIGADVADKLHYRLGQRITLEHGSGELAHKHADKPFEVVGILQRTGTPVDRTVHVELQAIQAIHLDWVAGAPIPGFHVGSEQASRLNLTPKSVTAALVGLKNRSAVFAVQRKVASYNGEPLTAVLPGVALDDLWQVVGVVEKALMAVSALVVFISFSGLISVVLVGLNERRRELAVLRAVGAGMGQVATLLALEGVMLSCLGVAFGACLVGIGIVAAGPWLQSTYGVTLGHPLPTPDELRLLAYLVVAGLCASLLPGLRAYQLTLADGLSPRT